MWDLPELASFMEALGGFARVIVFDPLGQGASDPISDMAAAPLEANSDDVLAVLDAAGSDRVTIFDMAYGVNGVTFAATYPQRTRSLILTNFRTSFPEVRNSSAAQRKNRARDRVQVESLEYENPRLAHDPQLRKWWGRARRLLVNPQTSLEQVEFAANIDVEPVQFSCTAGRTTSTAIST